MMTARTKQRFNLSGNRVEVTGIARHNGRLRGQVFFGAQWYEVGRAVSGGVWTALDSDRGKESSKKGVQKPKNDVYLTMSTTESSMKPPKRCLKRATAKSGPKRKGATHANQEDLQTIQYETAGSVHDQAKATISKMNHQELVGGLIEAGLINDDGKTATIDRHWMRLRLLYQIQETRRNELGLETPPKVLARIQKLDCSRVLPSWSVDIFNQGAMIGGSSMSKGSKKVTISATMVQILRRKTVPTNQKILEEVKEKFPESAFNAGHVSWYKGAFTKGKLPGQEGNGETFNQPKVRELTAVKPATSKKKSAKKASAKKAKVTKVSKKKVTKKKAVSK